MEKINIDEMNMHKRMDVIYMAHAGHTGYAGHSKHFATVEGITYHLKGGEYTLLEGGLETWFGERG